MNRSDLDRLRDARDFARHARGHAGGLSAEILADAPQPLHAGLFNLVIIGETLNKVSGEVKSAAPEIPWKAVTELRNFIVHSYWQIDLAIIADVIGNRLDPLVSQIEGLMALIEGSGREEE
jgi:uncharacterized protein with HEPN domain